MVVTADPQLDALVTGARRQLGQSSKANAGRVEVQMFTGLSMGRLRQIFFR